ncbi:MAG: signal peptidase I [Eubacteriales bacterium]|nr:signal peptidase I [Eubacteriales bacterium]
MEENHKAEMTEESGGDKLLRRLRSIRRTLISWVVVLVVIVLINVYIGRLVRVDGHSMDPNLSHGQLLIMDKITYRFRAPKRNEIVIFPHGDKLFIKRVIGLPGETVQIRDGQFYINGQLLADKYGKEPIAQTMYGRAVHEVRLGADEYFCVGDNRNHSGDSRLDSVGNVHRDDIRGRAIFRLTPFREIGGLKYD